MDNVSNPFPGHRDGHFSLRVVACAEKAAQTALTFN